MSSHTYTLSQVDIGVIRSHAPKIPGDIKKEFCQYWPTGKKVLDLLRNIFKDIPGMGLAVQVIGYIIAAGDTLSEIICK